MDCTETKIHGGYKQQAAACFTVLLLAMATLLLLQSCSTTPPPSTTPTLPWQARQQQLHQFNAWQLNGKMALQSAQDAGSANLDWQENKRHYVISLFGPFGTPGPKLIGEPGKITLITANGKHAMAKSPEELLAKLWGFNVPISNLYYWIRGLPAPGMVTNQAFDGAHRLTELEQQGWHIQFSHYTNAGSLDLPSKIFITSAALKIKIFISEWKKLRINR